jgi:hypothetical protein
MKTPAWMLGLAGGLGLLVSGCAKQLTYDNWQSISNGQSAETVKAILGKPVEQLDMRWMYFDCDRCITADIYFSDCQVIGKTWSDPEHGMQGNSPLVNQPGDSDVHKFKQVR